MPPAAGIHAETQFRSCGRRAQQGLQQEAGASQPPELLPGDLSIRVRTPAQAHSTCSLSAAMTTCCADSSAVIRAVHLLVALAMIGKAQTTCGSQANIPQALVLLRLLSVLVCPG